MIFTFSVLQPQKLSFIMFVAVSCLFLCINLMTLLTEQLFLVSKIAHTLEIVKPQNIYEIQLAEDDRAYA